MADWRANEIAKLLARQKPVTESLIEYSKREAFRQRDIPAKYVTLLTSNRSTSAAKQQAAHFAYNVKNCFRCLPTVSRTLSSDIDRNSQIPFHVQLCNIRRLEPMDNNFDCFAHYQKQHLGLTGERIDPQSCSLLIPCLVCVSRYLTSGRTSLSYNDHLYACCTK